MNFDDFFARIEQARLQAPSKNVAVRLGYLTEGKTSPNNVTGVDPRDLLQQSKLDLLQPTPRQTELGRQIERLVQSDDRVPLAADVVVITALPEEKNAVLQLLGDSIQDVVANGVLFKIGSITTNSDTPHEIRVAVLLQSSMGMVPAAILATKALKSCSPKYVIMTGICAGVENKVSKGDLIIADSVFDYGSGKIVDGKLHPDYSPIPIAASILELARDCAGRNKGRLLQEIVDDWQDETTKPASRLKAVIGPMASGAAVVGDEDLVSGIVEHRRNLVGIDMESYGVVRAVYEDGSQEARSLIVKSVTDFANFHKDDKLRSFASYASARFVIDFLRSYWGLLISHKAP